MNKRIIISGVLLLVMVIGFSSGYYFSKQKLNEVVFSPFSVSGEPVVIDKELKLMWMKCSLGSPWNGVRCLGEPDHFSSTDAKGVAKGFKYAGHSNWRLPTIDELNSLIFCPSGREPNTGRCLAPYSWPTIDQTKFPDTPDGFYITSNNQVIDFHLGTTNSTFDGSNHRAYVRLVRDL